MNTGFTIAAGLCLATWALHTFAGGRIAAKPLLSSDLDPVPMFTNYYCWHLITITLFVMSAGFAFAAYEPTGWDVGVIMLTLSAAYCAWSLALVAWKHRHPFQLPQWLLFLAISAAALVGVLG